MNFLYRRASPCLCSKGLKNNGKNSRKFFEGQTAQIERFWGSHNVVGTSPFFYGCPRASPGAFFFLFSVVLTVSKASGPHRCSFLFLFRLLWSQNPKPGLKAVPKLSPKLFIDPSISRHYLVPNLEFHPAQKNNAYALICVGNFWVPALNPNTLKCERFGWEMVIMMDTRTTRERTRQNVVNREPDTLNTKS